MFISGLKEWGNIHSSQNHHHQAISLFFQDVRQIEPGSIESLHSQASEDNKMAETFLSEVIAALWICAGWNMLLI